MFDASTAFDRRRFVPLITSGDLILSRGSFGASIKAALAQATGNPAWNRMLPPVHELGQPEREWMLRDFARWEQSLPAAWRSFAAPDPAAGENIRPLRRAV